MRITCRTAMGGGFMKHPTVEECERLLDEYGTPEHVRRHCREVARVAVTISKALNERGSGLDAELVLAAGMLHDIARTEDRHWDVGADIMEKLGYEEEGRIIRAHMKYPGFSPLDKVTETDMVCLGDRLVKEDSYVGLDARMDYIIDKAKRNGRPDAERIILEKKKDTRRFIDEIEDRIGVSIDELLDGDPKEKGEQAG